MEQTTTQTIIKGNNHKRYGFLSLMSMVVGILIGSGIFVKNQILYNKSDSTLAIIIAWFLVSFVVICIAYAFLEIVSSTKKSGKTGSLNVWAREFISPQAGKVIGFFFMFIYFPSLLSILAIFFGTQLMQGISTVSSFNYGGWNYFLITTALAIMIMCLVFGVTTYTSKTSKAAQVSATAISLIPLLVVIFSVSIIAIIPSNSIDGQSYSNIFNPYSNTNQGLWVNGQTGGQLKSGWDIFKLIIICTPGIMFTLDAFIWAAALSNETKKKHTLNWSLIGGVTFTIVLYILLTLSIFSAASVNGERFTVTDTLAGLFPNTASWLPLTIQMFVLLAIFTSLSGLYTVSIRNITALSETNAILDKDGKTFRRNNHGVPQHSSYYAFGITMAMFLILRSLDAIALNSVLLTSGLTSVQANAYSYMASGFASDLIMIGSFTSYAVILAAGLMNRKTNRVEVEKSKAFIPLSTISIFIVFIILVVFSISMFSPDYANVNGETNWTIYSINLSIFFSWFILMAYVYNYNDKKTKNITPLLLRQKQVYFNQYVTLESWENIKTKELQSINLNKTTSKVKSKPKSISNNKKYNKNNKSKNIKKNKKISNNLYV